MSGRKPMVCVIQSLSACADRKFLCPGEVMPLKVLGKSLVILSSESAATDLLEKRGAKYSDRPSIPMMEL